MLRGAGGRHAPAALPPEETQYPLYRRLGGPQARSGSVFKTSPPSGFDPQIPCRSESLYRLYYPGPNNNNNNKNNNNTPCKNNKHITPYITAESLASPLRIRGIMCSISSQKTYDADCGWLWHQRLQANSGIVYQTNIPQTPKFLIICHVLINLSFDP
jgi:hypothetical protein